MSILPYCQDARHALVARTEKLIPEYASRRMQERKLYFKSWIAFALLLAVLAGWYGVERARATQEKLAIADEIVIGGGEIIYEFPTFKSKVRHYFGREKYSRIRGVQFENKTEYTFDLAQLDKLSGFQSLHFIECKVDDETIRKILGLKKLRHLALSNVEISNAGLGLISQLQQVKKLDVRGTNLPPEILALWERDLANVQIIK